MGDNDIYKDGMEEDEEEMSSFASGLGGSFGVEVSEEAVTGKVKPPKEVEVDQNYVSPYLLSLKEAGEGVISGNKSPEELTQVVEKIYIDLEKTISTFEIAAELPAENEVITEQLDIIRQAFALNKKALDTVKIYSTDMNVVHITEGINMAQEATNQLNRAFNLITGNLVSTYRKLMETKEGSLIDTFVGEKATEGQGEVKYTTPNVNKLSEAIVLIGEGKLSDDDFKKVIQEVETCIIKNIEANQKEANDLGGLNKHERKVFLEYVGMIEKALKRTLEGTEEMKAYFTGRITISLEKGLEIAYDGAKLMAEAYAFKKETDKLVKEAIKEEREKKREEIKKEERK